jgi:hypothetical protein
MASGKTVLQLSLILPKAMLTFDIISSLLLWAEAIEVQIFIMGFIVMY